MLSVSAAYLIDILVNMRTSILLEESRTNSESAEVIRKEYMSSFGFAIDLTTALPVSFIELAVQ